jgi:jumonji domain-containing protein 7
MLTITRAQLTDQHLLGCEPILITDGLAGWPAMRWTPTTLAARVGDKAVNVRVSLTGSYRKHPDGTPVDPANDFELANVSFADATDCIVSSGPAAPKYYVSQQNFDQQFAELLGEVKFQRPVVPGSINLWFGSAGTITPLHFDASNNFYAQVFGSKVWTIFAPDDMRYLYPYPDASRMAHVSSVDVEAPDLERYPLYARARPITFTVRAGELLFLPAFWWHHVTSTSVSISVNQWWSPELTQAAGPNAERLLRFEYVRDRWAALRKANPTLSHAHLLASIEPLLAENAAVAVLAADVALADARRANGHAEVLADNPALAGQWHAVVAAAAAGASPFDDAGPVPSASALVREVVAIIQAEAAARAA